MIRVKHSASTHTVGTQVSPGRLLVTVARELWQQCAPGQILEIDAAVLMIEKLCESVGKQTAECEAVIPSADRLVQMRRSMQR